jgi:hypothetical protein
MHVIRKVKNERTSENKIKIPFFAGENATNKKKAINYCKHTFNELCFVLQNFMHIKI